jgi:hypothetical protein
MGADAGAMEGPASPGCPGPSPDAVCGEVGLRLARLGWDVRTSLDWADGRAVVECALPEATGGGAPGRRLRFPVTAQPAREQARAILASLLEVGWRPPRSDSPFVPDPRGAPGYWCAPEA